MAYDLYVIECKILGIIHHNYSEVGIVNLNLYIKMLDLGVVVNKGDSA